MSDEKNHIEHLSLETIKNYLAGLVTGKEANEIEQHLADCELCSDALLGLEQMDPKIMIEDVSSLRSRVTDKSRLRSKTGWWLRSAAAMALILMSTFFLIDYVATTSEKQLATKESMEEAPKETEALVFEETKTDSLESMVDETTAKSEEIATAASERDSNSGAGPLAKNEDIVTDNLALAEEDSLNPDLDITGIAAGVQAEDELSATPVDEEPILTKTEALREESKRATRSLSQPTEAAKPQSLAMDAIRTDPSVEILPVIGNLIFEQYAEPENGTDLYIDSLLKNLKYPQKALEADIQGFVRVRFKVSSDGSLSDYIVIDSLGYGCDEEAVRLIREGSGWKPASRNGSRVDQEVIVRIPFTLTNR